MPGSGSPNITIVASALRTLHYNHLLREKTPAIYWCLIIMRCGQLLLNNFIACLDRIGHLNKESWIPLNFLTINLCHILYC